MRHALLTLALLSCLAAAAPAQQLELLMASDTVSTIFGAVLSNPEAVAPAPDGSTWVAGLSSDNLFHVAPDGEVTLVFRRWSNFSDPKGMVPLPDGSLVVAAELALFHVDPAGVMTPFFDPADSGTDIPLLDVTELVSDGAGTFWVISRATDEVVKVAPDGTASVVVDAAGAGPGQELLEPSDLALDGAGNLYVSGLVSDNVLRVTPGGVITQIVGPEGDGAGQPLDGPSALAVNASGLLYVSGLHSHNVLRRTQAGVVSPWITDTGAGPGQELLFPEDLALGPDGTVYVAGLGSDNLLARTPGQATVELVDLSGDGAGNLFNDPAALAVAPDGTVYAACLVSDKLFTWQDGQLAHLADEPDISSIFDPNQSVRLAVDAQGELLVSLPGPNLVKRFAADGSATVVAESFQGDGHAFDQIQDIAVDDLGRAFVAATHLWRFDDTSGAYEIVARGGPGELFAAPYRLVQAPDGSLLILGRSSANVVALRPDGSLEEVWSTQQGFPGQVLDRPEDLDLGPDGSLYVANTGDQDVLVQRPDGTIQTLLHWNDVYPPSGSNSAGFVDLAVDPLGRVFVLDHLERDVHLVDTDGSVRLFAEEQPGEQSWSLGVDAAGALTLGLRLPDTSEPVAIRRFEPSGTVTTVATLDGDGLGNALNTAVDFGFTGPGRFVTAGYASNNAFAVDLGFCGGFTLLPAALPADGSGPQLFGEGSLCADDAWRVDLRGAPPSVSGVLVLGFGELSAPFQGGLLVPLPDLLLPLASDSSGAAVLAGSWPAGVPGGASAWLQAWFLPGGGSPATTASNALRLDTL